MAVAGNMGAMMSFVPTEDDPVTCSTAAGLIATFH
jgi:hypothetical protein